jgi:hypothetical protein
MLLLTLAVVVTACDDSSHEPFHETVYRVVNLRVADIGVHIPPGALPEVVEGSSLIVIGEDAGLGDAPFTPSMARLRVLVTDTASGDTLFLGDPSVDGDWERTDPSETTTIYELLIE